MLEAPFSMCEKLICIKSHLMFNQMDKKYVLLHFGVALLQNNILLILKLTLHICSFCERYKRREQDIYYMFLLLLIIIYKHSALSHTNIEWHRNYIYQMFVTIIMDKTSICSIHLDFLYYSTLKESVGCVDEHMKHCFTPTQRKVFNHVVAGARQFLIELCVPGPIQEGKLYFFDIYFILLRFASGSL